MPRDSDPTGLTLYPFQQDALRFLTEDNSAVPVPHRLLLLEQGLGKTVVAIRGGDRIGAKRILVLCPAIAREHWRREFERWQQLARTIKPVYYAKSTIREDVIITSYNLLTTLNTDHRGADRLPSIFERHFDLIILDEAQYLKSPTAKRTHLVYGPGCRGDGLVRRAARVWALSGTLTPNGPQEIWTHLSALFPFALRQGLSSLSSYPGFVKHYCYTRNATWGPQIMGVRRDRLPALKGAVKCLGFRRRQVDVLKDLPPLRMEMTYLDPERDSVKALDQLKSSPDYQALAQAVDALLTGAPKIGEQVSQVRRLLGLIKAPSVRDFVDNLLGADPETKVILFAHHREVIDLLRAGLNHYSAVTIDGAVGNADRQKAIDSFQSEAACRVLVGQINACGTAITLTAANRIVFAECSWSPEDNAQAMKRAHRIGQKQSVLVHLTCLAGSLDEAFVRVLRRKVQMIRSLWE